MEKNIIKQLNLIESANDWVKSSLEGEKQKNAHHNLVNYRRLLKKKKLALEGNPAAAIYGESQVGKSYLISSLLTEESKPFSIAGEGLPNYNFIEEINPPGGGSESTSLVSRFSVKFKPHNPQFPIQANLLTPIDLVLVLCDSFYNDIKSVHELTLSSEQINSEVEKIIINLIGTQHQSILGEDDIWDIRDYFKDYLPKAFNVLDSCFFDKTSLILSKCNPNEWKNIFSLLWNKNEKITNLFDTLISEYEKLNFCNKIYLPIESVLYRHGTLLDVKRLKEIYGKPDGIEPDYKAETKVLCEDREIIIAKPYLCALSAELIFCQTEDLVETKPFLDKIDLLDFPGARSRLTHPQDLIEDAIIPELLLRGKVSYLFNKYSDAEKINVLFFCSKHEQAAQRAMPEMLNNWVTKIIGENEKKREEYISKSKLSPLFIVSTFFNVNLQYNPQQDKIGDNSSLNYRWNQRFEWTLASQMLKTEVYDWFENWTISNPFFQNIFLLRDFEKSDTISHIFKGYNENKIEQEEVKPSQYPDFKEKLRQSFIDYDFVKRHFKEPAKSWDCAASLNKDGSALIIEQLTIAANNINYARQEKILEEINEISKMVVAELNKYFHSNDKDEELQKAKRIAGEIQFKFDSAFSADGIKRYGKVMKELMLDEKSVFELYRKQLDNIEQRDYVNLGQYITILFQVPVRDGDTPDSYFERLAAQYEKNSDEDKAQFRNDLEKQGVDLYELIHRNADLIKNNSQQLAEALIDYWIAHISLSENHTIQEILASHGSSALQDITEMLQKLTKKVGLAKVIAEKIRHYVDGQTRTDIPYGIASDISAELLNKFVNTVGFEYIDDSEINDLKQANEKNSLGLTFDQQNGMGATSVEEVFNRIENWTDIIQSKPEEMKTLPSYRNYLLWYNRLKIGFVSVCDIPNYDVAANETLGTIIKEIETAKY